MFNKVLSVQPENDCVLSVGFVDGTQKKYDIKQLFAQFPMFELLRTDRNLFNSVKVDQGGYGISWNDELDLSCNELYYKGV